MIFAWAGLTVRVTRQPLTRDWWEWITDVLPSGLEVAALKFAAQFVDLSASDLERGCATESAYSLVNAMFVACQTPGLVGCLSLTYGVDKLDREKLPRTCVCDACTGRGNDATDCRFVEVGATPLTRLVAAQEPDLVALMWERPYSLYFLAIETKQAERLGALASSFPVEAVRRDGTHKTAFNRLRRYHVDA
jgi:hypothetical protein